MTLRLKHLYCKIKQGKLVLICETNQNTCQEPQNGQLCLACFLKNKPKNVHSAKSWTAQKLYKETRCPYPGISCEECINPTDECIGEED